MEIIMNDSLKLSHNLSGSGQLRHEKPVNIVIDECCYSRIAMTSLLRTAGSTSDTIEFSRVTEFSQWRSQNQQYISCLIIHIHDRSTTIPHEIVEFLVEKIDFLNVMRSNVIIMSRCINHLTYICVRKLKIVNLLNESNNIESTVAQLKNFIKTGATNEVFMNRCLFLLPRMALKKRNELSPAEVRAIENVLTGQGIFEVCQESRGHYKTLYNQRSTAIKKLGMNKVQDLIKYRHLIGFLYFKSEAGVNDNSIFSRR